MRKMHTGLLSKVSPCALKERLNNRLTYGRLIHEETSECPPPPSEQESQS